jgi:hypothetical protein
VRGYGGPGGGANRHYASLPPPPDPPYFIQRWRQDVYDRYAGQIKQSLVTEVTRLDRLIEPRAGTQRLGELNHRLLAAHVGVAFDDEKITEHAEFYAKLCRLMRPADEQDEGALLHGLRRRLDFAAHVGVTVFATRRMRFAGLVERLENARWWRRQLRKAWTRSAENECRDLGMVHRFAVPFITDNGCRLREHQRRRGEAYLKSRTVTNQDGVQLDLFEVSQHTIANPELRRGEMMVRARGFEEIAKDLGHAAIFITATTPSAYHVHRSDGTRNESFQGFTPREAQRWLCKIWARARARLKRLNINVYGFRVAEPHHDATPHWHFLLFMAPSDVDRVRAELSRYWLSEFGEEPGALEHRLHCKTIDPSKGSATGYLAKYIAKNIDAAGAIGEALSDEVDAPVSKMTSRVEAWASIHGIRQFQQIGGPPVGLWRELRRIREVIDDIDIERARRCADAGSWRMFAYAIACGDPLAGRKTALKLEKVPTTELTHYGESRIDRVIGVRYCSAVVITRPNRWTIERKRDTDSASLTRVHDRRVGAANCRSESGSRLLRSSLGPVRITVRGESAAHDPATCLFCKLESDRDAQHLRDPLERRVEPQSGLCHGENSGPAGAAPSPAGLGRGFLHDADRSA